MASLVKRLIAISFLSTSALASPWAPWGSSQGSWGMPWNRPSGPPSWSLPPAPPAPAIPSPSCVTDADATVVANNFALLISNYTVARAEAFIANDYLDQADSVNTLINGGTNAPLPLGTPTFASKAAFIAGQGSQPNVPFEVLQVWHTCDTVLLRWVSKQLPQQVQGFDALEVVPQLNTTLFETYGKWQINTTYGEFNSGAWLVDIGCSITCPPPPTGAHRL